MILWAVYSKRSYLRAWHMEGSVVFLGAWRWRNYLLHSE